MTFSLSRTECQSTTFKSPINEFELGNEAVRDERLPSRLGLPQILLSALVYTIQAISLSTIISFNKEGKT